MSTFLLSWGKGVTVAAAEAGDFVVQGPPGRVSLRQVNQQVVNAFRQIQSAGTEDRRLADVVTECGDEILTRWYYYLDRLTRRGLLCQSAHENGVRLATLVAISTSFVAKPGRVAADPRIRPFTIRIPSPAIGTMSCSSPRWLTRGSLSTIAEMGVAGCRPGRPGHTLQTWPNDHMA